MTIEKRLENSIILNQDGNKLPGLDIGLPNKGTAGTEFSEIRKNNGYILRNNEIIEFNLPEITEIDNSVVIYTKEHTWDIKPLFNNNDHIKTIREIVNFFHLLKERGVKPSIYATNLLYRTDNNELLLMPPDLIHFINERESLNKKLSDLSIYRHPDLKDERSLLYSIGILLFQHTTDSYPIEYSDVEDLRDKMRRKILLKPRWKNIKLSAKMNNLIEELLDIDFEITLNETLEKLDIVIKEGIHRTDNDYKDEELQLQIQEKKFKRNEFFRAQFIKHRGLIIGSTLAAIVIVAFFGTIIANALKPPATTGFSKLQIVESYFTSFQSLDPELIDDVLAKGVRKHDSTEISTLYVTTKMRSQNDPNMGMLTPEEWLLLDDNEKKGKDVYGIYNLKIEPLNENKFQVKYEKWYTQASDDSGDIDVKMDVHKLIKDEIFTLKETKYSYEIINIETLMERDELVW